MSKKREKKGSITVYFALLLALLFSFTNAMIQGVSIQVSKPYKRAEVDRGISNIFAEYQKELWEKYDVFSLESTYESGEYNLEQLLWRMQFYGLEGVDQTIQGVQLLTDYGGEAFQEQVVYYMQEQYLGTLLSSPLESMKLWGDFKTDGERWKEKNLKLDIPFDTNLDENPLSSLELIKNKGIAELAKPKEFVTSNTSLGKGEIASKRNLNKGFGNLPSKNINATVKKLALVEYAAEKCSQATAKEEKKGLTYELEYLIEGGVNDAENLEGVIEKLHLIRFGANYLFIQKSATKKSEASAAALAIATAAGAPYLEEVIKQGLLLGWAFGESVMDLRSLLKGNKILMLKTEESWQLDLESLIENGLEGDKEPSNQEEGFDYEDYLKILLYLEDPDVLTMRLLDLIEINIRKEQQKDFFKIDHCVSKIEIRNYCNLKGGYSYEFPVLFLYQ